MESLIAIIGGALITGAVIGLKKLGGDLFLSNYGTVIEKTFAILDPIAGDLISSYDESGFQDVARMAVARVADNDLSEKDLLAITQVVIKQFNPALAASKKLDPTTPEGQATIELSNSLKALADGASYEELVDVARKSIALV